MIRTLLILFACVCLAGCMPHFKDVDSYNTLFRNAETTPPDKGDPYTFGGIAGGSGGTMARQSYATDNPSPDFRDATATGQLGEIAKDRTQTPGGLPGVVGGLPGAGATRAFTTNDGSAVEGAPEVQFIRTGTGQPIKPGDPEYSKVIDSWRSDESNQSNPSNKSKLQPPNSKLQTPNSGG